MNSATFFQEVVTHFGMLGWVKIEETETSCTVHHIFDKKRISTLNVSPRITKRLQSKFPHIALFAATWSLGEQLQEMRLYVKIKDLWHNIYFNVEKIEQQKELPIHIEMLQGWVYVKEPTLTIDQRREISEILIYFKELLTEEPRFRLHFTTLNLSFQEESKRLKHYLL